MAKSVGRNIRNEVTKQIMRGILGALKNNENLLALCSKNNKKEIVMSDVFHLNLTKAQLKALH